VTVGTRKIIEIDEAKCTGCGRCIPNCPEGALQVIDGKARLVSDLFCDGLGACVGHCPEGAMNVVEREAEPYDEKRVMVNIARAGPNTIRAHLKHLEDHGADEFLREAKEYLVENGIELPAEQKRADPRDVLPHGCPGSRVSSMAKDACVEPEKTAAAGRPSRLRNWPVQLMLMPVSAPYLAGADVVIAADCTAFSYADFHDDFIRDKVLIIACPKLDDAELYRGKLTEMFTRNDIASVTCVHMEVPCCSGLVRLVETALQESGAQIRFEEVTIGIKGQRLVNA
jgi:ferredoxin